MASYVTAFCGFLCLSQNDIAPEDIFQKIGLFVGNVLDRNAPKEVTQGTCYSQSKNTPEVSVYTCYNEINLQFNYLTRQKFIEE